MESISCLHKYSNCTMFNHFFLRHRQQWKKVRKLLNTSYLGGVSRVYGGIPPNSFYKTACIYTHYLSRMNVNVYSKFTILEYTVYSVFTTAILQVITSLGIFITNNWNTDELWQH